MLLLGCGLVMDCQTAKEYINAYADNMLDKKETQQLLSHISSCSKCKKDLDDILAVKSALSGLGEIEPPAGLALSAIKKARKRKVPVFTYASAGIAAAIALVAVFSSGILNNNSSDGGVRNAAPVAYSAKSEADMEMQAPAASAAPMEEYALAPKATPEATSEATPAATDENDCAPAEMRSASVPFINVPADVSDSFRISLEDFLTVNNIEYKYLEGGDIDTISFTITEDKLEELKTLISDMFEYRDKIIAGTVEFIFSK